MTVFVIDKNLSVEQIGLPGTLIDAKTRRPASTYKGPQRDDEDFADVLQLAFEERACIVSADAAMIEKARKFHTYVVGHKGDRCLDGVIIVPLSMIQAREALKRFLDGRTRISIPGYRGKPFIVSLNDVEGANLGINLRAAPPSAVELCSCPWKADR